MKGSLDLDVWVTGALGLRTLKGGGWFWALVKLEIEGLGPLEGCD